MSHELITLFAIMGCAAAVGLLVILALLFWIARDDIQDWWEEM